jgi:hypothetical protein
MSKLFSRSGLHTNSFKVPLLLATIAVASAAIVYAHLQFNIEQPSTWAVTAAPPREFSIRLEKTEFQLGELVRMNLTLKNIGNQTLVHRWTPWAGFDFDVLDANGTVIYTFTSAYLSIAIVNDETLDPGEEFTISREWNQTRLITVGGTGFWEAPIEKGAYQIVGKLDRWDEMVTPPVAIAIK